MTSTPPPSDIHALLPIKNLTGVKTRLENVLSADERRLLVKAMAEDVVAALKATRGLASIAVVTHDPSVAAWARSRQLDLIDDSAATGLSSAITLAARSSMVAGAQAILVVLADTPRATSNEFDAVLKVHRKADEGAHLVLCPSRDGDGSNCLLVAPPDAMTFHYGRGSAAAHTQAAHTAGLAVTRLEHPGIAHDIDTEADLRDLISDAQMLDNHSRTSQFLTSSGIAARLSQKKL